MLIFSCGPFFFVSSNLVVVLVDVKFCRKYLKIHDMVHADSHRKLQYRFLVKDISYIQRIRLVFIYFSIS